MTTRCPHCQTVNLPEVSSCTGCGRALPGRDAASLSPGSTGAPTGMPRWAVAAVAAAVLLAVGTGWRFWIVARHEAGAATAAAAASAAGASAASDARGRP
ncbi:hypothetical protein [Azohydromonas sp.]|uniref:hypothetical protein n=1 Tax=Azohydromonas sp. TaxID=1872666 RepID=UPI002B76274A|nr:hypothetical protein [Azohydromonas sp.]HMM85984.1 hypothetical protein [Azohydromonas sp.]